MRKDLFDLICQCISDTPFCCNTGWKLIYCSSRSWTSSEKNYSVPEGEALAITWALKRGKMFLLGHPGFIIITDYRSLTRMFGDKEFSSIDNPCLLQLKEIFRSSTSQVIRIRQRTLFHGILSKSAKFLSMNMILMVPQTVTMQLPQRLLA